MDRKALFFDIDGTLLAGGLDGYIPESAVKALVRAQENGHLLFINSGRPHKFMPKPVLEFPFDGYICGCGTEIIYRGESLYHYVIPKEIRLGMTQILHDTGIFAVYEGREDCFFEEGTDYIPPVWEVKKLYMDIGVKGFDDPELDYDKFVVYLDEKSDLPQFLSRTEKDFDYIDRGENGGYRFGEVVPRGCSKASGMDFILERLGMSLDDCFAFGDSTNDLSMLLHVKNSVAMGDGDAELFDQVSYVTTPVAEDGIKNALEHFGLI